MALERDVTIVSNYDLPMALCSMEEHYMATYEANRDSYRSWQSFREFVKDRGNTQENSALVSFEVYEKIDPDKAYLHFG